MSSAKFYSNGQALLQSCYPIDELPDEPIVDFAVPEQVVPESLLVEATDYRFTDTENVDATIHLNRQNGEFTSSNLVKKWLGQRVRVVQAYGEVNQGILLHYQDNVLTVQDETTNAPIIITAMQSIALTQDNNSAVEPNNNNSDDQLDERVNVVRVPVPEDAHWLTLSYLTNGFEWSCSYVLLLNDLGTEIQLGRAIALLDNQTSFSLKQFRPNFVIGSPNRARTYNQPEPHAERYMMMAAEAAPGSASRMAFKSNDQEDSTIQSHDSQYYELSVPGTIDINAFSQLQLPLFHLHELPVQAIYEYRLNTRYSTKYVQKASWTIECTTEDQAWPQGTVVVYQQTGQDTEQSNDQRFPFPSYVGSDTLSEATPPHQPFNLSLGETELVYGKHKVQRTELSKMTDDGSKTRYQIQVQLSIDSNVPDSAFIDLCFDGDSSANLTIQSVDRNLETLGYKDDAFRWRVHQFTPGDQLTFQLDFILSTTR